MKFFYLLLISTLLVSLSASGQCTSSITLTTQAQVNDFPANYGCSFLQGNLTIGGSWSNVSDISDLSPLSGISFITGNLTIRLTSLTDLSGIETLETVGGNFNIEENSNLTSLTGLEGFGITYGNFTIQNNSALTDLSSLSMLTYVANTFQVSENNSLQTISGFENVSNIGSNLNISTNPALISLGDFASLTEVGSLTVSGNESLPNLSGLDNLTTITAGDLNVSLNPNLTSLEGLSSLNSIQYGISIQDNDILPNLNGLSSLTELTSGTLVIHNCPMLVNLEGMETLTTASSISIDENDNLQSLEGLEGLENILNSIFVFENPALTSLTGLENLSTIVGSLKVESNPMLSNMEGLNNLTTVGGDLNIQYNESLTSLVGLSNLSQVGDELRIYDNSSLPNLSGLESINSINKLIISENESLTSIAGLATLEIISYSITITLNENLTSLAGLGNLIDAPYSIYIQGNDVLTECCPVFGLFSEMNPYSITIADNGPNCSSDGEVASHCSQAEFQAAAYFDENQNGVWDGTEQLLNQSFTLEPSSVVLYSNESSNTANYYLSEYGVYSLHLNDNYLWTFNGEADSIEIDYTDQSIDGSEFYFPMVPIADYAVHNIDLSSSITRCDRPTTYWLTYANTGTVVTDGSVYLVSDNLTTFDSAVPAPDSMNGDTLFWDFTDLYPSYSEQIQLIFTMPNFTAIGETIDFEAFISTSGDTGADKAILSSDLVCSYDPNDKLAFPSGVGDPHYTLFEEDTMAYTVRFQNTGNDTAFTVVVQDTISEFLDLNTFRPIASSHSVETTLDLATRIATFTFNDIYLPDSNVNEQASHGLVKFEIATLADIAENTLVENNAGIYFDFNPAVVTNTVYNTFVSEIPTEGLEMEVKVYLEGTYDNGSMGTGLIAVAPLSQPFNTAPWYHTGNESMAQAPADMVDWILVEARVGVPNLTGAPGTSVVEAIAGILTADGTIVASNGGPLRFSNLEEGSPHYFSLRHRNHLDVMTAVAVVAADGMQFDFTSSIDQAFGFQQQKYGNDGQAVMASGDINADGLIQTTDYDVWFANKATVNTYHPADLNLDNVIQTTDFDWWFFNKAKVGILELQD